MEAPTLVLVPPSPLKYTSTSSTPSPASTNTSRSTTSSHPHSRFSVVEPERTSSETTIFSIYSMYGDKEGNRSSWSASGSSPADQHIKSTDAVDPSLLRKSSDSYIKSNGFHDTDAAGASMRPRSVHHTPSPPISFPGNGSGPSRPSRPSSRTFTPSSSLSADQIAAHRASTGKELSQRRPQSQTYPDPRRSRQIDQHPSSSARSSTSGTPPRKSNSQVSLRDLPPLPPSRPDTARSSRAPSPVNTPPERSASLPVRRPPYTGVLSSHASLVPSEGEDWDAFHVRNTYAQLEMSGVKGDGFEEGVERTRARIGNNRASQINADAAVGDGNEKKGDLDPRELETLRSVDRYGFFQIPSHDRLILLPSGPLLKRLSRVPASAEVSTPKMLSALPTPSAPQKEASRILKWTRMLKPLLRDEGGNVQTWMVKSSKTSKLRSRVYKGIPDRWRAAAWDMLMSRFTTMNMTEMAMLTQEYRDAMEKASTYDIQIDLDVPRTISGHVMFRTRYGAGQRSLFHVLHAFSLRCPNCGYVQGMGPIAATLLCYFEPERVYASLVRLHDSYSMHSIFSPGFPGLLEAIYVQERIMEQMMPDVYAAFKKHMISTTSYATKWYITLFSNSVPFQTQLRLWDVFLLEGADVFIAVAIAIVWVYRDNITSSSANFETILSLLSSFFVPEDEDVFLSWIEKTLGDKKLRSNMRKWREDWKALVAAGTDGTALL